MKWSVGQKIGYMNAVAIIALISLSFANYYSTNRMIHTTNWRQHSYQINAHLSNLLAALVDAETGQRGYLIINQDSYLQPYHLARITIPQELKVLKTLTPDNEEQQKYKI